MWIWCALSFPLPLWLRALRVHVPRASLRAPQVPRNTFSSHVRHVLVWSVEEEVEETLSDTRQPATPVCRLTQVTAGCVCTVNSAFRRGWDIVTCDKLKITTQSQLLTLHAVCVSHTHTTNNLSPMRKLRVGSPSRTRGACGACAGVPRDRSHTHDPLRSPLRTGSPLRSAFAPATH